MYVRLCGTPEMAQSPVALARWPLGQVVTYFESLSFQGLTRDAVAEAFNVAVGQWMAVSGIVLRRVADPRGANIIAATGPLDGPYGVLAQSDLPFGAGPQTVLQQLYDDSEPWAMESADMLLATITHELGHALGLGHLPGTGGIMEPVIVPGRSGPRPPDVAEMVARYGPSTSAGATPATDYAALGHHYGPYLMGPFCDALVAEAKALEAGVPAATARITALSKADDLGTRCWVTIVEPQLKGLGATDRATALRAIAGGLFGTLKV